MPDKKFGPADDETETTRMPRKILKLAEEYSLPTGADPRSLLTLHNTENSKQIFPGKELRVYSFDSYVHVSVSDLYIPLIGLPILLRVGNFRQKNYSAEDGIDGTNGYFRRNSGCSAEQQISEFRSEPFRGRENNSEFRSVGQK
jgi:hypothetical protein